MEEANAAVLLESVSMSRAFVKEDVDLPERSGRARSASGLPPGALNYITASGAYRLRSRLEDLRSNSKENAAEIARLEDVMGSVTVVTLPKEPPETIAFGSLVTVRDGMGTSKTFHIVGVDEVELEDGAVSWISPLGKALLGAEVGDRVSIGEDKVTIEQIESADLAA